MGLGAWCVQRCSLTHLKLDLAQVRGRATRHRKILPAVAGSGGSPFLFVFVWAGLSGLSFGLAHFLRPKKRVLCQHRLSNPSLSKSPWHPRACEIKAQISSPIKFFGKKVREV